MAAVPAGILVFLATTGCGDTGMATSREDPFGRTYYIDGAGNWGYGVVEVNEGLRRAGYKGNIINWRWSATFNPALDQTIGRIAARGRGQELGKEITQYLQLYPDNQVNIICLSAGTGVGIWACENTTLPAKVNNIIMLGSSLSSDYDVSTALQHIAGKIYVYHSTYDMVLQGPVRTIGTIDGKIGVDAAGLVGLRPTRGDRGRIENIPWSSRYEQYGWTGSHTDATSEPFVRHVLAKIVVPTSTSAPVRVTTAYQTPSPVPCHRGAGFLW
ncbi:MAG TPA: hypothetical protein VLM89_01610 [Phycisphaerae bacterium]|nr:hypothetical protein [Phycisphaerae bacterium]